jgi:hypothetical protein
MKKKKEKKVRQPKTQAELAIILGISESLLSYHIKRGGPPISDVGGWLEYLSVASREGSLPDDVRRRIGEARCSLIEQQTLRVKLENENRQGGVDSIPRQATEKILFDLSWRLRLAFGRLIIDLSPQLVGLDVRSIYALLNQQFERSNLLALAPMPLDPLVVPPWAESAVVNGLAPDASPETKTNFSAAFQSWVGFLSDRKKMESFKVQKAEFEDFLHWRKNKQQITNPSPTP